MFAERKEIEYAYVVFDQHYYEATRAIFAFLEENAIYPRAAISWDADASFQLMLSVVENNAGKSRLSW